MRSFNNKDIEEAGDLVIRKFRKDSQGIKLSSKRRGFLMNSAFSKVIKEEFGHNLTTEDFSEIKKLIGKKLRNRRGTYSKSPQKRKLVPSVKVVEREKQQIEEQTLLSSVIPTHYY